MHKHTKLEKLFFYIFSRWSDCQPNTKTHCPLQLHEAISYARTTAIINIQKFYYIRHFLKLKLMPVVLMASMYHKLNKELLSSHDANFTFPYALLSLVWFWCGWCNLSVYIHTYRDRIIALRYANVKQKALSSCMKYTSVILIPLVRRCYLYS